jgi:benzodiazapine receptor
MKKYFLTLIVFLTINFGGLAIGQLWTGDGVTSDWYTSLNQAPWTPPGWVFGLAWTTIAITFSLLMTSFYLKNSAKSLRLFFPALILNISWNPVFFGLHWVWTGVMVLVLLSYFIYLIIDSNRKMFGWKYAWLGLPYFIWLMVATSLDMYISIMN